MTTILGSQVFIGFIYLVASALFILALKWMNAPPTARRGILAGEVGMVLAIGGTILQLGGEGRLEHISGEPMGRPRPTRRLNNQCG